jgi:hypothetical protein
MYKDMKAKIDFLGIGTMKAGTTWIYHALKQHPEICVSNRKEIKFFNDYINYKRGLKYYFSFFENCIKEKMIGEINPDYMYNKFSPKLIKKHFPNIKIIACLRNPIERAFSHYRYNLKANGKLSIYNDFYCAVNKSKELLGRGFYFKQLKRYFNLFPRENILIMIFRNLKEHPEEFVQEIYKFLDVDHKFIPSIINRKVLRTDMVKRNEPNIPFLNSLIFTIYSFIQKVSQLDLFLDYSGIKTLMEKITKSNRKSIKYSKNKKIAEIDKKTRMYLYSIYENDIKNLEKLLDIDLSFWK